MESPAYGDPGRQAVNRRRLLRISVKLGLLGVAAAFVVVFAFGLLGPGSLTADRVVEPAAIPPGTARLESWNGQPVWIVHRSTSQLRALADLSDEVQPPVAGQRPEIDNPHRSRQPRYGIYLAATQRPGVLLRYLTWAARRDAPRANRPDR